MAAITKSSLNAWTTMQATASIASDYTTEVCELFTHDLLRVDEGVYVIENEICEIKVVVCYRRNW